MKKYGETLSWLIPVIGSAYLAIETARAAAQTGVLWGITILFTVIAVAGTIKGLKEFRKAHHEK